MWTRPRPPVALRTVDVWDTLLRRRCHPDAVKLHTCRFLLAHRWADVVPSLRAPRHLLRLRLDVERDLARASAQDRARDDEYTMRDVIREWLGRALTIKADAALAAVLEREELAQEQRVSYADPSIAATLARHPAPRTLFLTDFYVGAAQVRSLLHDKGLGALVENGYSSCDLGVNKRSGRLFEAVQRVHGVTPQEHLHIGDDANADVKAARRLGMPAVRHRARVEERERARVRRCLDDRPALIASLQRRARETATLPRDPSAAECFRFGLQTAPLWLGHALFVLESVQRQRAGQLWFFSREGEFFAQVYSVLAAGSPSAAPPARTLEVSRAATFTASLQEPSIGEMQRLWRLFDPQSMRAWALSLGLEAGVVAAACRRCGIGFDEPVSKPADDPRIQRLLDDPASHAEVLAQIRERREALLGYLRECGFAQGGALTMIVDIGWRGTIQDNLALLFPGQSIAGIYLGLQAFVNPQPPNASKQAYGPDLNRRADGARRFSNLPLLEMLCASEQGSVTGYRHAAGRMRAARLDDEQESRAFTDTSRHFQAGVLHAARTWAPEMGVHALGSEEIRDAAMACWDRILARSPASVRRALAMLKHNEVFGRGRFAPLPQRASWLRRALGTP